MERWGERVKESMKLRKRRMRGELKYM